MQIELLSYILYEFENSKKICLWEIKTKKWMNLWMTIEVDLVKNHYDKTLNNIAFILYVTSDQCEFCIQSLLKI